MNCCNDAGRCTGGHGCAARTCEELGVCQGRAPRCAGCADPAPGLGLLAPGAIERHRRVRHWLGTPAQRRQVVTYLVLLALLMVLVGTVSMAAGYLVGARS